MDLQYVPQPLDTVGELCGFDGDGHHCHKGVLTRCKWMYNDIKKLVHLVKCVSSGMCVLSYSCKYFQPLIIQKSCAEAPVLQQ